MQSDRLTVVGVSGRQLLAERLEFVPTDPDDPDNPDHTLAPDTTFANAGVASVDMTALGARA
jgi:hypothetical protein